MYRDITEQEFEYFRKIRNEAGTFLSENNFEAAFEGILSIKRDVKQSNLHPSTFDNLLNEVVAIGGELSAEKTVTLAKFEQFMMLKLSNPTLISGLPN
jgi:hypothetical protein